MYIRQISVFLENTTGSLHSMTRLLGEHGVDLIALSIADSDSFGVLRCVAHSGALALSLINISWACGTRIPTKTPSIRRTCRRTLIYRSTIC